MRAQNVKPRHESHLAGVPTPMALELSPELEFDAAGSARAGRAGIEDAGDPAETGRGLDREVRSAAGHRADAGARILVFRMVQQVEGCGAEIDGHPFVKAEALLQRRVDFVCARAIANVAAQIAPGAVGAEN